jgi:hypothetical protein
VWPQTRGAWRQPLASGGVESRAAGDALNEGSAPAGPRPVPNRSAKLDGGRQSSVEWRDFKFGVGTRGETAPAADGPAWEWHE